MADTNPNSTVSPTPLPITGTTINNIVCGANLNCSLQTHLDYIARHARNASYNPKRFKAAILRLRSPSSTALIFESGKIQVLGTKSITDAKLAARKFARIVQKMGFQVRLDGFNVQNIVAHADVKMLIRLEGLVREHVHFCKFEPEIFPGLVYSFAKPKITALVFAKGKVVLLGGKCMEDVDAAMGLL